MTRALAILLSLSLAFPPATAFALDPVNCNIPEENAVARPQATAAQMTDVLCKASEDGRLQPSAETLAGQCKIGVEQGAQAFVNGLKEFADLVGSGIAAGYDVAKNLIKSIWTSEPDAAAAAEKAAVANGQVSQTWLQTVKELYETSKLLIAEFIKNMDHSFRLVFGTLWCFSWKVKAEYLCDFISQIALNLTFLKDVTYAADRTAAVTKVIADFMRKTNMIGEMKKLTFVDRMKAASTALTYQAGFENVERFGAAGNLKKSIDPITKREVFHLEETAVVDGQKVSVMHELQQDAKTLAVDANLDSGRKLAALTAQKSAGDHMLFIDVNNLGRVNYFKGGTQAGDEYLSRVGAAIRKNLRPEDRFFKNGGDELVVILKTKDPVQAKAVIQRIHDAIAKDKPLQELFKRERIAKAAEIKRVNGAAIGIRPVKPLPEQVDELVATARIRPSVSIGSARMQGDWMKDVARANAQADKVKALYKARIGLDRSKYANAISDTVDVEPSLLAQPPVLDPVR